MLIRDRHVDPDANYAKHFMSVGLNPAVALTNAVISVIKMPHAIKILAAAVYCRLLTVVADFKLVIAGNDDVIVGTTLAVSATAEKFKTITTTLVYFSSGIVKTKAATDNLVFSAAYTVNTAAAAGKKWGAFLVQIDAAGAVSTKAVSADQSFATEALAIASLPLPDAAKCKIGYITVQAKEADAWIAITDDLTAASDCEGAFFYSVVARAVTGTITPVAGDVVEGVVSETTANNTVEVDENLVVIATTDADAALTDGRLNLWYRAARVFRGE